MKTRLLIPLFAALAIFATSCKSYVLVSDSSRCPKQYEVYKSSKLGNYVEKGFDLIQSQKKIEDRSPISNLDSTFIPNNYQLLFNLFQDYFTKEYDAFNSKMGKSLLDWDKGFVKIAYSPWPEMPLASAEIARQFDLWMSASAKEWNRIKLGGASNVPLANKIFSKAFMVKYLDASIQSFMDEYAQKTSNPMVKHK